ncbi:MAG: MetQ/NlpA family ABC transporter substrate-binding protein, partial [Enterococcus faecalis]|nr:MetQ/NlpA family ABC transporter substrate-binding protein [Enterococcus faecalis]
MKKFYLATFAVIATVILAACGGNKQADQKKDKEITVAVQLESSKDILEIAKKEAEKKGYKINIMEVSDNVAYNDAVQHDEADA